MTDSVELEKFWMVYRVDGICNDHNYEPSYRHLSLESAKEEAERLCNLTKGIFLILEAMELCRLKNIEWHKCKEKKLDIKEFINRK